MKLKKISKKLVLKRSTISTLSFNDLKNVNGGIAPTHEITCPRLTCIICYTPLCQW
jgi:hypothetical protein